MANFTSLAQVQDQLRSRPAGIETVFETVAFGGQAAETIRLIRTSEFGRWMYQGAVALTREVHYGELARECRVGLLETVDPPGLSLVVRWMKARLLSWRAWNTAMQPVVLTFDRQDHAELTFQSTIFFETRLFLMCQLPDGSLELHAGPYRLALSEDDRDTIAQPDHQLQEERLREILARQGEVLDPRLLTADGGSNPASMWGILANAAREVPVCFDDRTKRYGPDEP